MRRGDLGGADLHHTSVRRQLIPSAAIITSSTCPVPPAAGEPDLKYAFVVLCDSVSSSPTAGRGDRLVAALFFGISSVADQRSTKRVRTRRALSPTIPALAAGLCYGVSAFAVKLVTSEFGAGPGQKARSSSDTLGELPSHDRD